MLHFDLNLAEAIMRRSVEERLRQAEIHRLLRQVRGDRPGWLRGLVSRILSRLGRVLVILGWRLQRYGSAPPLYLEPGEMARP